MMNKSTTPLRICAVLFILSLPISYFSVWLGFFIKAQGLYSIMTPFLVVRLTVYGVIMTIGMFGFQRLMVKQNLSLWKVILTAFCAPLIIFLCLSFLDSVVLSLSDGTAFQSYLLQRISLYLSRFYMIGICGVLVSGLIYYLIDQKRISEPSAIF